MKNENYIDSFIEREKQQQVNPFLSTRIMARIEAENTPQIKKTPALHRLAFAFSILLVVFLGINIGNIIPKSNANEITLNINDTQIENLTFYNLEDDAN